MRSMAFGLLANRQRTTVPRLSGPLNLVLHGNSLYSSVAEAVAARVPASYTVTGLPVGGASTEDLTSQFVANVDSIRSATKTNVVAMWEGLDDINDFGATAVTGHQHYAAYVTQAEALGWYVYTGSIIDTTEFDPPDVRAQYRTDFNTLLRGDYAGAYGIADFMARPELQDATNLTYFSVDGIHITGAGQIVVAEVIAGLFV